MHLDSFKHNYLSQNMVLLLCNVSLALNVLAVELLNGIKLLIKAYTIPLQDILLPYEWDKYLLPQDQKWISKALFRSNNHGKIETVSNLKIWWHPPPAPLLCHQPPQPDLYFTHRLCLWMLLRMWLMKFHCIMPTCKQAHLVGGGIHKRVCWVLDVDSFYYIVTERLVCSNFRKVYLRWGMVLLDQLDMGHRSQFPAVFTGRQVNYLSLFIGRTMLITLIYLFIWGFYVTFNTVQVISRRVVGRAEETSTYS